jgi:uncharacterized circularly permuted ATP-grasp superfamily protein
MTTIINTLIGKALDQSVPYTWQHLFPDEVNTVMKKLAELVVKECIDQLEVSKSCDPYTGELYSCDRNDNINYEIAMLKEHFGD